MSMYKMTLKKIIIQQVKGSAGMINTWLLHVWLLRHHHQAAASLPFLFVHFPSLQVTTTLRQSEASSTARRGLKTFVPEKACVFIKLGQQGEEVCRDLCAALSLSFRVLITMQEAEKSEATQTSSESSLNWEASNRSRATVIEINWIWEIITFMLICVLRGDNSGR